VLTPEEMAKVLDSIDPASTLGGRDRAFYELMYSSGARFTLAETYGFTAGDRTAPKVLAAPATAQRTVQVGFDEQVLVTDPTLLPSHCGGQYQPSARPSVREDRR
jgi:site-specific recombinase XerC